MQPFSIAGMQLDLPAHGDNIDQMERKLDLLQSLYPWVQMVVFSELSPFGPSLARAQEIPGPTEERFREMARRHSLWLLPGTMFEKEGDHTYNTATVLDPDGEVVGRYRKQFPFRPYEEGVEGGEDFLVFDVPDVGRFGVSICYDMWFPETTRTLVSMGAEVILHPTMTTTIDREVELSIARASAAINQCFFFDINGVGEIGVGKSIIVGPYGDVLHEAGSAEELIPLEIDLDRVRRSREFGLRGLGQPLKSFRDRRVHFGIYAEDPSEHLSKLGPLTKPTRGTRAGLRGEEEPS